MLITWTWNKALLFGLSKSRLSAPTDQKFGSGSATLLKIRSVDIEYKYVQVYTEQCTGMFAFAELTSWKLVGGMVFKLFRYRISRVYAACILI